jgi:hypothetical protein
MASGFEDYFDKDHEDQKEKLKKITAERNFYRRRLEEIRAQPVDDMIQAAVDRYIEQNEIFTWITDLQAEVTGLSTDVDHAEVDVRNLRADVARLTAIVESTISKE